MIDVLMMISCEHVVYSSHCAAYEQHRPNLGHFNEKQESVSRQSIGTRLLIGVTTRPQIAGARVKGYKS
jgi:hypothetical protein